MLSLFVPARATIWLNGQFIDRIEPPAGAVFPYAAEVPLHFVKGDNLLAVQVESTGGPWTIQAAIVEPGFAPPEPEQLVETFIAGNRSLKLTLRDRLTVRARVDVVGAGGRVMDTRQSDLGGTLVLDPTPWPDGAYEIRVRATDPFGAPLVSFLPWTKGEPAAIIASAKADAGKIDGEQSRWRLIEALLSSRQNDPEALNSITMEATELALGPEAATRSFGFVRLAWTDDVDGSDQFCRAYLPADYTPEREWPTVVNLHGFNPANPSYAGTWGVTERHHRAANRYGVIWLEPHGRGNTQYIGIGEQDVMRCLAEAKESLAVDPARTYLTGESMGGSGTWLIGSRHPTTFAALAPIFGGWDFRIHPNGPFSNPDADRLMERWLAEAHSSFAGAEQLINTPVLVLHGDADEAVDVEFSRHIVGLLQRWHYDVRYLEFTGSGHEDLNSLDIVVPWLLQHQLDREPKRVRIRSVDLSGARSAWLDVVRAQRPLEMIEVDAEVLAPGQVRLDTKNVSQVRLRLPDLLRSADGTLAVTWNGITTRHSPSPSEDDVLLLPAHSPAMTRVKNSVRSGGLSHVFTTPFVLVIGTISDDEAMNELLSAKAEQFVQLWQTWQHVRPRVIRDVHLTDREAAGYSLVLLGGPEANAITRRLAGSLPFTIEPDRVVIDGRNFSVDDAVAEMVYPSPLSADRYIMLVASTSAEGMWLWDPSQYWRPATGQPTNFYDWIIADARVPMLEPGLLEERGWVASGVFDTDWRRGNEFTFLGDASARADAPVRRSTDHGVTLAPADLARLTGSYNLPDTPAILEVREIDGHLELAAPGEPALRLLARSPNRLVTSDHRTVLSFSDEAHSCTLSLERAGQRATWRRIGAIGIDCASD